MTELAEVMCWRTRRCEATSLSRVGDSGSFASSRSQPSASKRIPVSGVRHSCATWLASEAAALSFSRAMRLSP